MGVTEQGKNWRLQVSETQAGTYHTIGGEKQFDWSQASTDTDTSDKDGPSGVLTPGRTSFSVQGNVKLPDDGLELIYDAKKSGDYLFLKATKGATIGYHGAVSVGNWKGSFGVDGPVSYSFDMANAAPPIVDNLAGA